MASRGRKWGGREKNMKKIIGMLVLVGVVAMMTGCATMSTDYVGGDVPTTNSLIYVHAIFYVPGITNLDVKEYMVAWSKPGENKLRQFRTTKHPTGVVNGDCQSGFYVVTEGNSPVLVPFQNKG